MAMTIVDEALKSGLSHEDLYVDIFAEALHRVGALWEGNQIGVAQEHIATSITQYAIASIYPRLAPATVNLGSMVVTGLAGELHQVGANLVADSMEARGWSVRFFGTNLPHSSIVSSVEDCAADVLCISTTIVSNLPAVRDLVAVVRAKLKDRAPRIVLGGGAYLAATSFAEDLGAIGPITTLRRGLELLCS